MIQQAREAWEKDFPVALEEERVQFMAHDFFTEQTVREADVYVLRQILSVTSYTCSIIALLTPIQARLARR